MKAVFEILGLALLFGVYSCNSLGQGEKGSKPVDLSSMCVHITRNGNRNDEAPILMLHGMAAFKEINNVLLQYLALKTGRRVCAADLRNHGTSPWSYDCSTYIMAKDVKQLLDTLEIEKAIIHGHSLGGAIGIQFALNYPEKVEKLIVEDMRPNGIIDSLKPYLDASEKFDSLLKAIPEGLTEREAKRFAYGLILELFNRGGATFDRDDNIIDYIPIKCLNGKYRWMPNYERIFGATYDLDTLFSLDKGQFNGSVLFLYGEKSPFRVGDVKEEILTLFPMAEIYEVKNAGHIVSVLPEFKDKVLKFIQEK